MNELALNPVLIPKPHSRDTWGLDAPSEAKLTAWMLANLELAIEPCNDPHAYETELVSYYTPPLNLTKCLQTAQHQRISQARSHVFESLRGSEASSAANRLAADSGNQGKRFAGRRARLVSSPPHSGRRRLPVDSEIDTAEAIAARYGLNPKSYRQRLRNSISWYHKPQDWSFRVGSREWKDMIEVAECMTRSLG